MGVNNERRNQNDRIIINRLSKHVLLNICIRGFPSYPAFKEWGNRAEPHYFYNPETLKGAMTDVWLVGDFNQKSKIVILLEVAGW